MYIYGIQHPCKKKNYQYPTVGLLMLITIVVCIVLVIVISQQPFTYNAKIYVQSGDTFQSLLTKLGKRNRLRIKWYIRKHKIDTTKLEIGKYVFSGEYTPKLFIEHINRGPEKDFFRLTILEGRSIYDTDQYLHMRWGIQLGEYVQYVTNKKHIMELQKKYEFLQIAGDIYSLEGFLYPDTYFVEKKSEIIPSLVHKQLETFNKKARKVIQKDLLTFYSRLSHDYSKIHLDWYDILILSSIVYKEEKNPEEQKIIADIFLRRMQKGMRLDADITVCYGLRKPYQQCKPNNIGYLIKDTKNKYNTRQIYGLPPTPIAAVPVTAIQSVLFYQTSPYRYYLHDSYGNIHYSTNLEQHNILKKKYIK